MKKYFKRYLALVLTFALVLAVPFAFTTQKADAAAKKSKKTTVVQIKKSVYTYKNEKGKTKKATTTWTYNKRGFVTKVKTKGGDFAGRTVYKYNKKGYLKSMKEYNKKGKLEYKVSVTMNKNGMPATVKKYDVNGKKSTLTETRTFQYSGKTPVNVVIKEADGTTQTVPIEFYDIGVDKEMYKEGFYDSFTLDKKGRVKTETATWNDNDKSTFKYTYNKAGYRIKSVENETVVENGKTLKYKWVNTYRVFKMSKANAKISQMNEYITNWFDYGTEDDAE